MSIWTHVVGCIRVDGLPSFGNKVSELEDIIGPMCLWDSWNEASTLPKGSEGGLQYKVIEYGTGLPWVVIPIWGDLRNFEYEQIETIKKWWNELMPRLDVRDAVLRIETEGHEAKIFSAEVIE